MIPYEFSLWHTTTQSSTNHCHDLQRTCRWPISSWYFGVSSWNPSLEYPKVPSSAENTANKLNAAKAKNKARIARRTDQIKKEKSSRYSIFQDICERIGRGYRWKEWCWKEENHSLSQSKHSYWMENGVKEEGSFVLESGLCLQFSSK